VNRFRFCKSRRQTHRGEEHIVGVPAAIADPLFPKARPITARAR